MKKSLLALTLLCTPLFSIAQCATTNISGNHTQSTDIVLSGIINVTGTYTLPVGVTITVPSYGTDNCGSLTINASKIVISGNIIADGSGYLGGSGGLGATLVTSITGHEAGLTGCIDKDNPGQITVGGGFAGAIGGGSGGGAAGNNGTVGSGTKQVCQNFGDDAGLIGGGGGGGGGGGASYGGDGSSGSSGGGGSSLGTANGFNFSTAYTTIGGIGGIGGTQGSTFGTANGTDIDLGSGGAGAGGGGRSFYVGLNGSDGGNGGGMIKLVATDSLIVSGNLSANGNNGAAGGNGGSGDRSPDCCTDGCNDCAERTLSAAAGGGSGSGAGSGGGIFLQSNDHMNLTGTLSSNGGNGGGAGTKGTGASCVYTDTFCSDNDMSSGDGNDGSSGGSGGGGRIKIFATNCPTNVVAPTHSENGGTGANAGTYQVVISGCPAFIGIENFEGTLLAHVYPNPAEDQINVQIDAFNIGMKDVEILVYDATGRILSQRNSVLGKGSIVQIPVEHLSSGIYSVVLRNNNAHSSYKFIKK